jgi:hypothetical protein
MSDRHYILLLILLYPALALTQTIHVEKDRVAYKGKLELHGSKTDHYSRAKEMLLNIVKAAPDSIKENKEEKELTASASIRLPSDYHLIKVMKYKLRLKPVDNGIGYEIGNIRLELRERGKKGKTLLAEEILKGLEENGKVGMMAETQLNEIDMNIQKVIASMQLHLRSADSMTRN